MLLITVLQTQNDSLIIPITEKDSVAVVTKTQSEPAPGVDTSRQDQPLTGSRPDTIIRIQEKKSIPVIQPVAKKEKPLNIQQEIISIESRNDSNRNRQSIHTDTAQRFVFPFQGSRSFDLKPLAIWQDSGKSHTTGEIDFIPKSMHSSGFNWVLFVGMASIMLLLSLKFYYQKFVTKVVNTMVNFQLADNMLREKSIIVRRAFFMMNLNYILVFSLFILIVASFFGFSYSGSKVTDYFLTLVLVTALIMTRLLVFYLVGYIFEWMPAVIAHIHNSYLVNKNLGLLLFPIIFAAVFTSQALSGILIYTGLVIVLLATLFKLIRGFQIIIRNGILLFYAILYLCTLELLPLILGVKVFTLLR
jgi:hypothetical protein